MTRSDYSWGEAQDELNGGEGGLWFDDDTVLTVTEAIDRFSATKLYIQLGKEDLTYKRRLRRHVHCAGSYFRAANEVPEP